MLGIPFSPAGEHQEMPSPSSQDQRFMRIALGEAAKGRGLTSPNPAVGAVIAMNGRFISKGYHRAAGLPHAEIEAIRKLLPDFRLQPSAFGLQRWPLAGHTLYVTLEPCSSHGRTPPCTEAIIAAGIPRVVYGATDPDKRHRGRAARILRKAGIEVVEEILGGECSALNSHWNHRQEKGYPWVIAKAALSLDGRIDSPPHRRWITSAASRREAMKLRASVEAILVGGGAVHGRAIPRSPFAGMQVARRSSPTVARRLVEEWKNPQDLQAPHRPPPRPHDHPEGNVTPLGS